MDTPTETPAAAPAPELSLDEIIAAEVSAAAAAGADVVAPTKASTEEKPAQGGSEPDGAHTADPPGSTPGPATDPEETPAEPARPDEISAARARKILQQAEAMVAKAEARERELTEREATGTRELLAELFRAPKALLAKHGKDIDDLIDASVAEGKEPHAAAATPADDRLTALEKRIADREKAEQQAQVDTAIANRKAEIHREIAASPRYPVLNEVKRHGLVTDYMVEYHSVHGKPISWDAAAAAIEKDLTGVGIAAAKKLGWSAPAAKPPAEPAKERPGTTSIGGSQRDGAPTAGDEPEDPEQLLKYLVAQAGL